ncbi:MULTISPECIES: glycerol-3-phosphate 1-O-acyltransferase PlsY [unclassified Gilliamella]|uniref:glycerol-3-phosphate 1-O-acyltransferase PlsY n=1 Tax=unclassified Gilliamella TaxID=2685620 RepID=UPI0022699895|nr:MULTISPECIES: glycerol-3-phosphate 1-O-acyltransferase PlsY [unclassified Gilliamella]MCX8575387.1 glycerol-3-phosphate 1-O-acyltransferase PlsY [Gilliamella sp. B3831]MCX8577065.1 glycerol-3-phosphate 1-O-acyltransferase PlsY [Gilliamella sp. B3815]MCX8589672.1 glycerol-3-phosphate 1-O-acyltransferase PlsY [Gilliamella sp. B3812]MCX8604741.1 glycerol-3-phosphate 1-O-acyltransferase PlsY [Gilliamella sp. B3823]MCX8606293.1 glycerol-3-phosphate 1-O-acyltransferase PlsY [Gilliamella sp. B3825
MSLEILAMIIIAYLCGSLSGAMIVSHAMKLPNPLTHGSHNPGATNILRINGKLPAIVVLIFDMFKGTLPVYLAYRIGISPFFLGIIGISACLGHIFPCFFHFKGGKGVATALGMMAPIGLDFTGCFILTWLMTLLITGYSSVAAIIGFLMAPFYVWLFKPELTLPVTMLSCLIIVRHSSNIMRLLKGEEPKSLKRLKL